MKDEKTFRITPGGNIETMYDDGIEEFAKDIGADVAQVCRASLVEREGPFSPNPEYNGGWTVRAAHNTKMAARYATPVHADITLSDNEELTLVYFATRQQALNWEIANFWRLLPPKKGNANG